MDEPLVFHRGEVRIYLEDGDYMVARPEQHAFVLAEFKAGRAFVDTVDVYGDPMTIKLGRVTCVKFVTPDGIRAELADIKADRAMRKADSLLNPDD